MGHADAGRSLHQLVNRIEQRMKFALIIVILTAVVAIVYFVMRSRAPRKKRRSQFFSHTFDNSGAAKVAETPLTDDKDWMKP
ncbi:hypothetical protein [Sphingomonas sp.]|jgi:FtsZ-interacting cell division protein ZipA|uniref:hypothetical protein n=1 Tax=Sphingomonas sp. TaxID=28214 RepID=UPI003D6D8278